MYVIEVVLVCNLPSRDPAPRFSSLIVTAVKNGTL